MRRKVTKILLPILILSVGVWGTQQLLKMNQPPKKRGFRAERPTLVELHTTSLGAFDIMVKSNAKTQPETTLVISPEIKGRITRMNPNFTQGAWVKEGTELFLINPEDYLLGVEQAKAAYAEAEYGLALALAKQKSAIRQTQSLSQREQALKIPNLSQQLSSLATFEPQVKSAQAALKSAKAKLSQAELNLKRTRVLAPFDGYIQSISIASGQLVQAGQGVGTLIKDRPILLKTPISLEELQWIDIADGREQNRQGSIALVSRKIGEHTHVWKGTVVRQLQEMDSLGKSVTVLIEVRDPLSDRGQVLPLGLFVEISIKGRKMKGVMAIPQDSLRSNGTVWLYDKDKTLKIQPVTIKWKTESQYLISKGLEPGDRVVTSYLSTPVPGMKLKPFKPQQAKSESPGRSPSSDGSSKKKTPKDKVDKGN